MTRIAWRKLPADEGRGPFSGRNFVMIQIARNLVAVMIAALPVAPLCAADFHAGVAVVDITGPRGYRMSGYFNERLNTGTHDPLQAKAVVFRQGERQGALVFCDLIGPSVDVTSRARQAAAT